MSKCIPIFLTLLLVSFGMRAEIVKCTMPDGQEVYTNQACDGGTTEVIKLRPIVDLSATAVEQNMPNGPMTLSRSGDIEFQGIDSSIIIILMFG